MINCWFVEHDLESETSVEELVSKFESTCHVESTRKVKGRSTQSTQSTQNSSAVNQKLK